ncbi:hypothetical protein LA76x_4036 [Lysobacter antibioticus]|uniref:Uncharacterized protein n=1 Tax=Lysobacter antibioticus TaxID=84531 RepID=A0A0S2FF43_LYSAN|nr:hypothetical protein LA76x_4036 [Lysobacter antibioticus]
MPAPGFSDKTSLSYRKTPHVLCGALRVYACIASSELRQAFTAKAKAKAKAKATATAKLLLGSSGATATALLRPRDATCREALG